MTDREMYLDVAVCPMGFLVGEMAMTDREMYLDSSSTCRTRGEWVIGRGGRQDSYGWIVYRYLEPALCDGVYPTFKQALEALRELEA